MTDESGTEDVWHDDLLLRRRDGEAIYAFLLNRSAALIEAGRPTGFTLAIDGEYGSGKSYLLRRLYDQVRQTHPAAFVDAWADDTTDAPWAALLVALEEALKPFGPKIDEKTKEKLKNRSTKLITALAKGAAKKGASYVIGEAGWDEAVDAIFEKEAETKIAAYLDRRKAITGIKASLNQVLSDLTEEGVSPPLFIFIDELDRCRPTYAIQFLEEIKHIFDVPRVVFVMAIHVKQLEKSTEALYGSGFNGSDYLRRFIDKRYDLPESRMIDLVNFHIDSLAINKSGLASPEADVGEFIGKSFEYWDVKPRYAIRVLDNLATAQSLWNHPIKLRLELLLPLIIASTLSINLDDMLRYNSPRRIPRWEYPSRSGVENKDPKEIFQAFWTSRKNSFSLIQNGKSGQGVQQAIFRIMYEEYSDRSLSNFEETTLMSRYPKLVSAISPFAKATEDDGQQD